MIDHNERNEAIYNANKEWLRRYHINDNLCIKYEDGTKQLGTIVGFSYNVFYEILLRISVVTYNGENFAELHPGNKTFTIEKL